MVMFNIGLSQRGVEPHLHRHALGSGSQILKVEGRSRRTHSSHQAVEEDRPAVWVLDGFIDQADQVQRRFRNAHPQSLQAGMRL